MNYHIVDRAGRDRLGEGPTWDPRNNVLLWVDIDGHKIHRLDPDGGVVQSIDVGQPVGWALPMAGSTEYVAGLRDGFAIIDLDTESCRTVSSPEPDRPNNRLNDAKVDRDGRIWAGSKGDTDSARSGALYRLDPDLSWTLIDDGYGVANGPTFSLDYKTLYHTDSADRTIYAFDLNADGSATNKRIWRIFPEEWGYPDGMTTDAEGCIWIAHWAGGRVSRFAPDGAFLRSIALPASNITSCCFGGEALDRMFVTSSTIGCEDEAFAGALFELDPGVRGRPPVLFGAPPM